MAAVVWSATPAGAVRLSGRFTDDDTSVHEQDIEAIAAVGVTLGCNPPDNDRFCPTSSVTRGQMAAFLHRAFADRLTPGVEVAFSDIAGSEFSADIEWLGSVGVTLGCNPPANDRYCPDGSVTRGQMAAFLMRALDLTQQGSKDFVDDDSSEFEADIERLATAGITLGCNPPDNDRFCPTESVTRQQMASFLTRALGLTPIVPTIELSDGWFCSKDGERCSGSATMRSGRAMRVSEGWDQVIPFAPGEETQFRAGGTRFELRIDDAIQTLEETSGEGETVAVRSWERLITAPSGGTFVIEGRWYWNDSLVRQVVITVTVT
jgi:hypothetical protein